MRFTNSLNLLPLSRNTLYIGFAHTLHMFTYTYFIHFRCVLQLMRLRIILLRVKFYIIESTCIFELERTSIFPIVTTTTRLYRYNRKSLIARTTGRPLWYGKHRNQVTMEATKSRSPQSSRWYQEMTHLPVGCECSLRRIRRTNAKKRGAARAANNDTDDQYREEEGGGLGLGSPRPRFLFLEAKPNRKRAHQLFTPRSAHT